MINPALLQKAMERKQKKEAEGFNAPAFFRSSDIPSSYVEEYFVKNPIVLMESADEMFKESAIGHMEVSLSVWEMLNYKE